MPTIIIVRKLGSNSKTALYLLFTFGVFLAFIFWDRSYCQWSVNPKYIREFRYGQECYAGTPAHLPSIELLPDVMAAKEVLERGENIFFHQTSCQNYLLNLTIRQACAIESAALTNPDSNVFVLFASPTGLPREIDRPKLVQALDTYPNIRMHNMDIWNYTRDTPAQDWIFEPPLFESKFRGANVANLLRLVSLYKFGGIYVDLDMIVLRNFKELGHNYAGFETEGMLTNSLMNFKADGVGHFIVEQLISEFVSTFNGSVWGVNGPVLLTRVLKRVCQTDILEKCTIFTAYPIHTFYPIFWAWTRLFNPNETEKALNEASGSMTVHFWNHMSANEHVPLGKKSLYDVLAKEFCPMVYATTAGEEYF